MRHDEIFTGQVLRLIAPKAGNHLVKVVKVNPKNIKVQKTDGQVWNVSPYYLNLANSDEVRDFASTVAVASSEPRLGLGVVVRFKDEKQRRKYPLLVVVGEHSGAFRLAPLGGDNGRYYRGITPEQVEIINFETAGV